MEPKQYLVTQDLQTSCFDEEELYTVEDISDLNNALCEAKIRFDTHPKNYTKQDYMYLVNILMSVLTKLYKDVDPATAFITTIVGIANTNTNPEQDVVTLSLPNLGTYLINEAGIYENFLNRNGNPIEVTENEVVNIVLFIPIADGYYRKIIYKTHQEGVRLMHPIDVVLPEGHTLGKYTNGDTIEVPPEGLNLEELLTQIAQTSLSPSIELVEMLIDNKSFNPIEEELPYFDLKNLKIQCTYKITINSIKGTLLNEDSIESYWNRDNESHPITIDSIESSLNEKNQYVYTVKTSLNIDDTNNLPIVHKSPVLITFKALDTLGDVTKEKDWGKIETELKWKNKIEDEINIEFVEEDIYEQDDEHIYISSLELPHYIINPTNKNNIEISNIKVNNTEIDLSKQYEFIETEENSEYTYVITVSYNDGDVIEKTINVYKAIPMFFGYMSSTVILNHLEASMKLSDFKDCFTTKSLIDNETEYKPAVKLWQIPFIEDKDYFKKVKFDISYVGNIDNFHAVIAYPAYNIKEDGEVESGILTEVIQNMTETDESEENKALNVLGSFIQYSDGLSKREYIDKEDGTRITAPVISLDGRQYYVYYSEDPTPFSEKVNLKIK